MSIAATLVTVEPGGGPRRRLDPALIAIGTVLVLFVLAAALAPVIAPHPPNEGDILIANAS
ncbi:MAG: hypothetical protein LBV34_20320, partial [Nocardiopsaceae bacterium]|nr:hypothetical protein [Nocardiopsaceae bacterium]